MAALNASVPYEKYALIKIASDTGSIPDTCVKALAKRKSFIYLLTYQPE